MPTIANVIKDISTPSTLMSVMAAASSAFSQLVSIRTTIAVITVTIANTTASVLLFNRQLTIFTLKYEVENVSGNATKTPYIHNSLSSGLQTPDRPTRTLQAIVAQNATQDTWPDWVPRSWYQLFIPYLLCNFLYERKVFVICKFWKLLPDRLFGRQLAYPLKQNWKYWRVLLIPSINPTRTRSWFQLAYPIPYQTHTFSAHFTPTVCSGRHSLCLLRFRLSSKMYTDIYTDVM